MIASAARAMREPRPNEIIAQIQEAWRESQAQLSVLQEQVEHATEMAKAKVQTNLLSRDLEIAYRNLGEAVWAEISRGKLVLPQNLAAVKKALEEVTRRIREQNASINDLLAEGADLAKLRSEKMAKSTKAVAPAKKNR